MPRRVEMLGGVPVFRVVATADVAAGATQAKMHPSVAHLEAFLAAVRVAFVRLDEAEVAALSGHEAPVVNEFGFRARTFRMRTTG
jgi:hypothetical protein